MRKYEYSDAGFTFMRVAKDTAAAAYRNGLPVVMCSVNLRPGTPWNPEVKITPDGETGFETACNRFRYYNCINSETGRYIAYYLPYVYDNFTGARRYDYAFSEGVLA